MDIKPKNILMSKRYIKSLDELIEVNKQLLIDEINKDKYINMILIILMTSLDIKYMMI